jgi:hypothetical protein
MVLVRFEGGGVCLPVGKSLTIAKQVSSSEKKNAEKTSDRFQMAQIMPIAVV